MISEEERRKHQRLSFDHPLEYSLSVVDFKSLKKFSLTGTGIDLSEQGLGFKTGYPLEPGHVIKIKETSGSCAAIVKWVSKSADEFRVGVFLYR